MKKPFQFLSVSIEFWFLLSAPHYFQDSPSSTVSQQGMEMMSSPSDINNPQ